MTEFRIESWNENDPRWAELVGLFDTQGQLRWVLPDEERLRPSSEVLVAVADERPVGFLVFLVQEIGPPTTVLRSAKPRQRWSRSLSVPNTVAVGLERRYNDAPLRLRVSSAAIN